MGAVRSSQVIAISLAAEMAKEVSDIAKKEQRSISELFREAFRHAAKVTVVHDSGIWISAIRLGGLPGRAILRTLASDQLAISVLIQEEVLGVMKGQFGIAKQEIKRAEGCSGKRAMRVKITYLPRPAVLCRYSLMPESDRSLKGLCHSLTGCATPRI